jgi:hypothetical protein
MAWIRSLWRFTFGIPPRQCTSFSFDGGGVRILWRFTFGIPPRPRDNALSSSLLVMFVEMKVSAIRHVHTYPAALLGPFGRDFGGPSSFESDVHNGISVSRSRLVLARSEDLRQQAQVSPTCCSGRPRQGEDQHDQRVEGDTPGPGGVCLGNFDLVRCRPRSAASPSGTPGRGRERES